MVERMAALLAVGALFIAGCDLRPRPFSSVFGNDGCRYKDATYSHGSTACQSGTQYRCDDGQWKGWGAACAENPMAAAKGCDFDGNSYSPGSASCQSGTQYRCDDGAWRNLALACAGGAATGPRWCPAGGRACTTAQPSRRNPPSARLASPSAARTAIGATSVAPVGRMRRYENPR